MRLFLTIILITLSTSFTAFAGLRYISFKDTSTCDAPLQDVTPFRASGNIGPEARVIALKLQKIRAQIEGLDSLAMASESKANLLVFASEQLPQAKELIAAIQTNLEDLRVQMLQHLSAERVKALRRQNSQDPLLEYERSMYNEFNGIVGALNLAKFFWAEERAWWFSRRHELQMLVPQCIALLPFDFTIGFAVYVVNSWSGVIVHMNSVMGEVQTVRADSGETIAITGVNADGTAKTRTIFGGAIGSAFNSQTNQWGVITGSRGSVVSIVYNPIKGIVEWYVSKEIKGAVFNPSTGRVETNSSGNFALAGYYDPIQKRVVWHSTNGRGIAILIRQEDGSFYSTSAAGPQQVPGSTSSRLGGVFQ